jgi:hypothetical protein
MQLYNQQALLMSIKDAYGTVAFVVVITLLIVLLSNYRTTITRFLPGISSVRKWMSGKNVPDPTLH